ncbi:asparagine synthase (glutamine-hydrolyzing) [Leeia oryzae]|uniref:asparagine synthase (glutamine-hydrolyzing) n=1 Tax=Leeia oryzae TaxID=356662 RepID=UPI00039A1A0F|nr:asparagine synthase (glutamine-hydrolyzing) [Leeia oryzae]
MCGISGVISTTEPFLPLLVQQMNDCICHRGPDDEGYVLFEKGGDAPALIFGGKDSPHMTSHSSIDYLPASDISSSNILPNIALGHRRLAIVDLSPLGHQPMSYANTRYWIVYNGEVYNHLELRNELTGLGYAFVSHSDTEVILAAYTQWGQDCLCRLNGMFAFAIYDRHLQTMFLARDRFGVKPLYYWISNHGMFAFGSEIKQFTVLPEWQARLNHQRAYDFLAFGMSDHTDETMFAGVYQVPPGHYALLDCDPKKSLPLPASSKITTHQWYTLTPKPFSGDYQSACEQFNSLFEDAVALRLRADVPVGSCLSGGLDSSAIVCMMNKLLHHQNAASLQKTFSACSDVARFDERKWIDIVVSETGVQGHYVYPSLEQLFEISPRITWHQDEPFGSTSIFAQWSVFQCAKENDVTVMLDGQGSDEQLAGYHSFFGPHLASLYKQGRFMDLFTEMKAIKQRHGYSYAKSAKYLAGSTLPEPVKNWLKQKVGRDHTKPEWLNQERLRSSPFNPLATAGASSSTTIAALSIAQLTASNVQMLLHWEDRDSMAHSIESRVPFLDYRLVEFVIGLPDEFKLSAGITKRILRDALHNTLPSSIRSRMDKLGFVTPEEVWLRELAPDKFRTKLADAIVTADGILKPQESMELLESMINGTRPFSFLPWRLINFGEWIKTFSVQVQ